jgi:hypothetical protein
LRRIVAYAGGDELAVSRDVYVEVLGMQVTMERIRTRAASRRPAHR